MTDNLVISQAGVKNLEPNSATMRSPTVRQRFGFDGALKELFQQDCPAFLPAAETGRHTDLGSAQRLDCVAHVKNLPIGAFDQFKVLAKLLEADFAFGPFPQQTDHFRNA